MTRKTLLSNTPIATITAAIAATGEYIGPVVDINLANVNSRISIGASIFAPTVVPVQATVSIDMSNNGEHWERDVLTIELADSIKGRKTLHDFTDYNTCFIRIRIAKASGVGSQICVDAKI